METQNTTKPKTSKLAIASLVLGLLSFLIITILPAIICGIMALMKISRNRGQLKGKWIAISGLVVTTYLSICLGALFNTEVQKFRNLSHSLICGSNIKKLGIAINEYTDNNGGNYPNPDKWCDIIKSEFGLSEKDFQCPTTENKLCSYAWNINITKNKADIPEDMVLLFETTPGWNKSGEIELVSTDNHQGRGCHIMYPDGHSEFVRSENLDNLKWTVEQ